MKRSSKSKMSLPKKIFLWVFGILVILAIVAVVYVAAKIFITGNKIHNPLDRNHSELRDKKVSLNDGDPFTIALFVSIQMLIVRKRVAESVVIVL